MNNITHIVIGRHKNGHGWYGTGTNYVVACDNASKHAGRKSIGHLRHRHIRFDKPVTNIQVDAFGGVFWEWVNGTGEVEYVDINA